MATEIELQPDRIGAVAAKLDGLDGLTDEDRAVIAGVFAMAGAAMAPAVDEPDVEGFILIGLNQPSQVSLNFEEIKVTYTAGPALVQKGWSFGVNNAVR